MHARIRTGIALLTAVLATAACASQRSAALFGEPEVKQVLRLKVTNNNFSDAGLYLLSDGSRRRLGTVTGKSSGDYSVTWTKNAPIQIEVDFIAGSTCTTRAIMVSPGDELALDLGLDMANACNSAL